MIVEALKLSVYVLTDSFVRDCSHQLGGKVSALIPRARPSLMKHAHLFELPEQLQGSRPRHTQPRLDDA